jgi:hypothetical protein
MARIPESTLEDIRSRIKVSEVVGARVKLKKSGATHVGLCCFHADSTLPGNLHADDKKQHYKCYACGEGGDVFEFVMKTEGLTFERAAEKLASQAGVSLGDGKRPVPRTIAETQAHRPLSNGHAPNGLKGKRVVAKTYDYLNGDGVLLYQVVRFHFQLPDGRLELGKNGNPKKTFGQRRPHETESGIWVWGLGAGEFMRKGPGQDWIGYDEDNFEKWQFTERATFDDAVPHSLYRLPELLEERAQGDDARICVIPEGEKDVETLEAWGFLATTNSGGAKHWLPSHAEMFRGLRVIIPIDNDKAGRERGHMVAASLRGIAQSVAVLDWRDWWPMLPDSADLTDWRDYAGGNKEKLYQILDKVPEWVPSAPESSFNAVTWARLDAPAKELEWLIKSVLTRGEVSVWYGQPGSGKSFIVSDACMAIARGLPWFGRRVRQGLVIYQAGEGGLGLKKRLRAYRQHHGMAKNEDLPFVMLPSPINLFLSDADVDRLIAEIKQWAAYYDAPLELVVIDTMSSAIAGADENASGDMTKVLSRCRKISQETGAHVALVHHTPKGGGSPRGWSGLSGNVENMIEVVRSEQVVSHTYADGRRTQLDLREFVTVKQKDDVDKFVRAFTLPQIKLGVDVDGDPITSCVVEQHKASTEMNAGPIVPPGYVILQPNQLTIFKALQRAFDQYKTATANRDHGVKCPEATYCVRISEWRAKLEEMTAGTDEPKRIKSRVQKAVERAVMNWTVGKKPAELLGHDGDWVWRMERKVHGVDPPPSIDEPVQHNDHLSAEDAAAMLDLR